MFPVNQEAGGSPPPAGSTAGFALDPSALRGGRVPGGRLLKNLSYTRALNGMTTSWERALPGAAVRLRGGRVPGGRGKVMSWDDDFLGARASRPHRTGHGFADLSHFHPPGTGPLRPFRRPDAVPAHRAAACRMVLKLNGCQAAKAAGCLALRWPQAPVRPDARAGTGCGRDARAPRRCRLPLTGGVIGIVISESNT